MHLDLKNKDYVTWRNFLARTDAWDAKQIELFQLKNLRRIVTLAYESTTTYREMYQQAGIKPKDITSLADIRYLPFITKEAIRDNLNGLSTPDGNREYVTTGGSTGIPLGFYRSKRSFAKELASKAHQYARIGWREGSRQMVLRGLVINTRNNMQYVRELEELRCSTYHLTEPRMEKYRKAALKYKPDFIKCYPSAGYSFARYVKDSGKPFPPLKGVLCASENLYDYQKNLMQQVFRTRIFSHYGHYELAVLAGFCEHEDTYHVLPQYGYAELLDSNNNPVTTPGQTGEVIATSFIMDNTPFIRYRTQDTAVLKGYQCKSCKRPYQVWEKIEGRLQEFVISKKGEYISMTAINMHNDIFDDIKQFQFYQKEKGLVTFRYVPKFALPKQTLRRIHSELMKKFGSDISLRMRKVVNIPPTARGKHRFLIQKLPLRAFQYHD